jgi:hypothetical protein
VDRSSVGVTCEDFTFPVELGKIREFARATFADRPEYLSGTAMPPTFLYCARLWQDERSNPLFRLDMDPQRSLHAEQEFVFHDPPPLGRH